MKEETKKEVLFRINDLECGYYLPEKKENKIVLKVDELTIYKGEFVVLLGNSGSGKSTLLETLGLMANRIVNGSVELNCNGSKTPKNYLKHIWKSNVAGKKPVSGDGNTETGDENLKYGVTRIRRENFNFIFQENNLMHNLTNSENIVIADLINDTKDWEKSYDDSKEEIVSVNLPEHFCDHYPKNISGGERQRVAFARATQPEFKVLFGDEPTGNLDEKNAEDLMQIIRNKIQSDPEKTAIIVSHNIELSLSYADRIILLTPNKEHDAYDIKESNILIKTAINENEAYWHKAGNGKIREDRQQIREEIKALLADGLEKKQEKSEVSYEPTTLVKWIKGFGKWIIKNTVGFEFPEANTGPDTKEGKNKHLKLPVEFADLFLKKEIEQLTGKNHLNFKILTLAILVTFLIIGFSSGQLNDLEKEMKDPFVNAVDVVHKGKSSVIENAIDLFMSDSLRTRYGIDTISKYNTFSFPFIDYSKEAPSTSYFFGRTIPFDDPMLDIIVSKQQKAVGRKFNKPDENGIIVTRILLEKLGFEEGEEPGFLVFPRKQAGQEYLIPLPVIAVVDKIPESKFIGVNYFLCTPNFYDNFRKLNNKFLIGENERIKILLTVNNQKQSDVTSIFGGCSRKSSIDSVINTNFKIAFENVVKEALAKINAEDGGTHEFGTVSQIINSSGLQEALEIWITDATTMTTEFQEQKTFYDRLIQQDAIQKFLNEENGEKFKPYQSWFSNTLTDPPPIARDFITVNFKGAGRILEFEEAFKDKTSIELDMAKVQSMNTFFKVSRITNLILFFLIAFSVVAIMLYIYSLMNLHIYKIRKNIGTLKAFGAEVNSIFQALMISFVSFAVFLPAIIVIIIDVILYSIPYFFEEVDVIGFSVVTAFNSFLFLLITIIMIYAGAYLVYLNARKKYFALNPSELIYSKEE